MGEAQRVGGEEKPTEGCGLKIKLGVCYRFIDVNGMCSQNSHALS